MNQEQNQSAHIRAVIAASPEPMSFGQISASAGVPNAGLGTLLNRMVQRGHLVREGSLGSFRYSIGNEEVRYVRCQTEGERRERYQFCQQRRRDRRRLANGGRTMETRRAEGAAKREAKNLAREMTRAERLTEAEARKAEVAARQEARVIAKQKKEDERQARIAKPARAKPAKVIKTKAMKSISLGPSIFQSSKADRPAESVEQFIARGGSVERLPGFQRIAERQTHPYGRSYQ